MSKISRLPEALKEKPFHYCPGCTHGIVHRLIAEVIDELAIRGKTILVSSIGCSVLTYDYFNVDAVGSSHGRAPASATGVKRVLPESIVFTYQGDGDLVSIGMSEIVHAAARGEKFTVIFVNNAIYGMTGGQMAPTTLMGQKSTTSPAGRIAGINGYPIHMVELLATLQAPAYLARTSVHNPAAVIKTKRSIKKAFETQISGQGFSLVEILSTCPTNWGMTPQQSLKWLEDEMIPEYPLGEIKFPQEG